MAETLCPGILHRETEFTVAYDPILKTTSRRFGTCGQQAAHSVLTNVLGRYLSTADIYTRMRSASLCDPSGASTAQGLRAICLAYGGSVVAFRDWTDANWTDWQATFNVHAGVNPFLYETHAGQQLVDSISGKGENAQNLQNHFVAVLGRHTGGHSARAGRDLPPGFWCADGCAFAGNNDNAHGFNAANVLQFYGDTAIAASLPRAAVVLKGRASLPMAWHKQADGSGKDDKGHTCGQGIMSVLAGPSGLASADGLMSERYRGGNDSVLPLANGHSVTAHHDPATGKWTIQQDDAGGLAMLVSIINDRDATVHDRDVMIVDLNAKLAAAQSTPQTDPLAAEALAFVKQQKAQQAAEQALFTKI